MWEGDRRNMKNSGYRMLDSGEIQSLCSLYWLFQLEREVQKLVVSSTTGC